MNRIIIILLIILMGIFMSFTQAKDESSLAGLQGPKEVNLIFPCDAKEITNIWVDDEIWWDGEELGSIFLKEDECPETLELHSIIWYESIVVEWILASPERGVKIFRFRLKPDGSFIPQYTIPISKRRNI